jgi:hypothetical protein
MTAKVRDTLRHEGFVFQFSSLEAVICRRDYTKVEPDRPEVAVSMSEPQWMLKNWRITLGGQGKLSLTPAPFQFGCGSTHWDDTYFTDGRLHSTTYYPTPERAEIQQTIVYKSKCLDRKDCVPSTGEFPVRVPYIWESKYVPFEYRWRLKPVGGGGWDVRPFAAYRKPASRCALIVPCWNANGQTQEKNGL